MAANGERGGRQDVDGEEDEGLQNAIPSEQTPLLDRSRSHIDQNQPQQERSAESLLRAVSDDDNPSKRRRWPSLLALLILCLLVILIMVFAFFAPSVVEEYATQAVTFEPTSLSIDSFTMSGVKVRIQGDFMMDASRVENRAVRDLGRAGTWIAGAVESGETEVNVILPDYDKAVLGTALVPGVTVSIRDGHTTHVDILSDLRPGDISGIRAIAHDWIRGNLDYLKVVGIATVPIKSGIFNLGEQVIKKIMIFANNDIPTIPQYEVQKLNFRDAEVPPGKAMAADVSLTVMNDYPIELTVPPLGFQILVDNCLKNEPYILVADAVTQDTYIRPKQEVGLNVTGIVRQLPNVLTQDCPGSDKSPLDVLLGNYIRGRENTVYVRGSTSPLEDTPAWIGDMISDIIVPVPVPGKTLGHLIKNFSLTDTHFSLPDPFAQPETPESKPRITGNVRALVLMPQEMNFDLSANRVRADADVYYKGSKFGNLDLSEWQEANSTRIEGGSDANDKTDRDGPYLLVESSVKNAPLDITDDDVFTDVVQSLVFGHSTTVLDIRADIDVEVETALGEFKVRRIPAQGQIPIKPIIPPQSPSHPGNGDDRNSSFGRHFSPNISDLRIVETTATSLKLTALVNITNPTLYTASVPFIDIHIVKNGSVLGHAIARNLQLATGANGNLLVEATYDPSTFGGANGSAIGRELLSQYISGWNTTLTLQTHKGSIPSQPALGQALSKFAVEIPAPKLTPPRRKRPSNPSPPDDGEDEDTGPHFITDATMHLLTSTATFTLLSPLRHTTIVVEDIDATAMYHDDEVGHIAYDLPFAVPPVDADGNGLQTPRLPVDWSLGSVGYEAVRKALGGQLKLDARAEVGVKIGEWRDRVWFAGRGIGARIRL